MKMKHILKYSFSLLVFVLAFQTGFSQEQDTVVPTKMQRYGLRVGLDLQHLARTVYDKDFKGFEITADYRLSKKIYFAGEIGTENKTTDDDYLNFTTKGTYIKAGIDFNAYENWLNMENMIYIGFRYGFSTFSQNLNRYTIYYNTAPEGNTLPPGINLPPNYFEDNTVLADKNYGGLSAHWAEVVAGIKAEIFNNLFIGFSARLNYLITDKKPDNFDNLYIPGFNRTYDGKFGVGFNYTVSYFIPLYKKKAETKKVK